MENSGYKVVSNRSDQRKKFLIAFVSFAFTLAFVIAVSEMFTEAKAIAAAQTTMMPFIVAGVFYYIFNFVVAFIMGRIEKSMDYYD